MENETPILIGMSTIAGTIVLYMSYSMNNPLLLGVALIIYGIGFGGAFWNWRAARYRKKEYARAVAKREEGVNRLR